MAHNIKIDLNFLASIGGMDNVVQKVQQGLTQANKGLDFSKSSQFTKLFETYGKEYKKFQDMTASGRVDVLNSRKVIQQGETIIEIVERIKSSFGGLKGLSPEEIKNLFPGAFSENIDKARASIDKLKESFKEKGFGGEFSNNLKKVNKEIQEIKEARNKLSEKQNIKKTLEDSLTTKLSDKGIQKQIEDAKKLEAAYNDLINTRNKMKSRTGRKQTSEEDTLEVYRKQLMDEARKQAESKSDSKKYLINVAKTKGKMDNSDSKAWWTNWEEAINDVEQKMAIMKEKSSMKITNANIDSLQEDLKKQTSSIGGEEVKKLNIDLARTNEEITKLEAKAKLPLFSSGDVDRLKKLENNAANFQAEINKIKTDKIKELFTSLEKGGFDIKGIDQTEDGLQNLYERLNDINKTKLNELINSLDLVDKNTEEIEAKMGGAKEATREFAESSNKLKDFANQLNMVKSRMEYFFSVTGAIMLFRRGLQQAIETVKELDAAMTEIAVVSEFDVGEMWKTLPQFSNEAKKLGTEISDVYKATTLYVQQGLEMDQALKLSNETLKMARIAGMDAATATDAMTAALRGFNLELNEMSAQRISDVYSELAKITASDTEEISTAMTKVASIAKSANMELETTSAFLAQIIETTREAPETAGTALKTVIARFAEVKGLYSSGQLTGATEEGEEISVNKVGEALKTAGIDLNTFLTGARGLDEVLLELAGKWDSLDLMTQRYIATIAAGSRQQSRFIALMSDYSRTTQLVDAAYNSTGSSQKQFEKTLESLESKMNKLKNAWNEFLMNIANSTAIKLGVDLLTLFLTVINKITDILPQPLQGITNLGIVIGGLAGGKKVLDSLISKFMELAIVSKETGGVLTGLQARNVLSKSLKQQGYDPIARRQYSLVNSAAAYNAETNSYDAVKLLTKEDIKAGKHERKMLLAKKPTITDDEANMAFNRGIQKNQILRGKRVYIDAELDLKEATAQMEAFKELVEIEPAKIEVTATGEKLQEDIKFIKEVAEDTNKIEIKTDLDSKRAISEYQGLIELLEETKKAEIEATLDEDDKIKVAAEYNAFIEQLELKKLEVKVKLDPTNAAALDAYNLALSKAAGATTGLGTETGRAASVFGKMGASAKAGLGKTAFYAGESAVSMGALLGTIGLVVAALVAVGVAAYALWYNSDTQKLKRQTEDWKASLEDAKKSVEEITDSINKLKEDWESFTNTNNELDSLVEGTLEWKQKLIEANNVILDLAKNYGILDKVQWENGRATLQENNYESLLEKEIKTLEVQNISAQLQGVFVDYSTASEEINKKQIEKTSSEFRVLFDRRDYEYTLGQNKEIVYAEGTSEEDKEKIRENIKIYHNNKKELSRLKKEAKTNFDLGLSNVIPSILPEASDMTLKAISNVSSNADFTNYLKEEEDRLGKNSFWRLWGASKDQYEEFAKAKGYRYENGVIYDKEGKEVKIDRIGKKGNKYQYTNEEVAQVVAASRAAKNVTNRIEDYNNILSMEKFSEEGFGGNYFMKSLLAGDTGLSQKAITDFTDNNNIGISTQLANDLIENLQYEDNNLTQASKDILTAIGVSDDDLENFENSENKTDIISNALIQKAQAIQKTQDETRKGYGVEVDYISNAFLTTVEEKIKQLNNIYGENIGNAFKEGIKSSLVVNGEVVPEDAWDDVQNQQALEALNFNSPIKSLTELNKLSKEGNFLAKSLIETLSEVNGIFSAESQFKEVFSSEDFKDAKKSLEEIYKTEGKITFDNIQEASEKSESLKDMLDLGQISATGFAKAMEALSNGTLTYNEITSKTLESLTMATSLMNTLESSYKRVSEQDFGKSFADIGTNYSSYAEIAKALYEAGAYGDPQLSEAMKFLVGDDWNKAVAELGNYKEAYERFKNEINKLQGSLLGKWEESWKNRLTVEERTTQNVPDAAFTVSNGQILFDLENIKSTDDLIENIMQNLKVSKEEAQDLLADATINSKDLRYALELLDKSKALANLIGSKRMEGEGSIQISQNEAELLNLSEEDLGNFEREITLDVNLNTTNTDKAIGNIKSTLESLISNLNTDFWGKDLQESFDEAVYTGIDEGLTEAQALLAAYNVAIELGLSDSVAGGLQAGYTSEEAKAAAESAALEQKKIFYVAIYSAIVNAIADAYGAQTGYSAIVNPDGSGTMIYYYTDKDGVRHEFENNSQGYSGSDDFLKYHRLLKNARESGNIGEENAENLFGSGGEGTTTSATPGTNEDGDTDTDGLKIKNEILQALADYKNGYKGTNTDDGGSGGDSDKDKIDLSTEELNNKEKLVAAQEELNDLQETYNQLNKMAIKPYPIMFANLAKQYKKQKQIHDLNKDILKEKQSQLKTEFEINDAIKQGLINYDEKTDVIEYTEKFSKKTEEEKAKLTSEEGSIGKFVKKRDEKREAQNAVDTSQTDLQNIGFEAFSLGQDMYNTIKGYAEQAAQMMVQAFQTLVEWWTSREDWLYNLLSEIEQEVRMFNRQQKVEERVDLYSDEGVDDLVNSIEAQKKSLETQLDLNEQLIKSRQAELSFLNLTNLPFLPAFRYSEKEGKVIENPWVYNIYTLLLKMGAMIPTFGPIFSSIQELMENNKERMEEAVKQIEDARDEILEIEKQQLELRKKYLDEQVEIEEKVMSAIIEKQQEQIDEIQALNDAISEANQKLIDVIQTNLSLLRQQRDNEKTEEELGEKERRLAYLRQDTSGANSMEIKKLSEELDKSREDYTDKLIDQKISALEQQNEEAAEQRQRQIDLLQSQLDYTEKYGLQWEEARTLIINGFDDEGKLRVGSELFDMLMSSEEFTKTGTGSWNQFQKIADLGILTMKSFVFILQNGWDQLLNMSNQVHDEDTQHNKELNIWQRIKRNVSAFFESFYGGGTDTGTSIFSGVIEAIKNYIEEKKSTTEAETESAASTETKKFSGIFLNYENKSLSTMSGSTDKIVGAINNLKLATETAGSERNEVFAPIIDIRIDKMSNDIDVDDLAKKIEDKMSSTWNEFSNTLSRWR